MQTAYGIGNENKIHLTKEIKFPSSLGLMYSTITAYLGFKVNNSEYKVMGLSPYGLMDKEKNQYYNKLRKVIDVKDDGSYRLDMSYFVYHFADRMPSKKLCRLLGGPVRKPELELTQRHKDIAAALQMVYEEVLFKILNHKHFWAQPDPGDGGTSIGAACYVYNTILGNKRSFVLEGAFLGPRFSTESIKRFLYKNNIQHSEFKDEKEMIEKTAKLIYNNKMIGWFQGRMEWGPRALGSRSILANPCNPKAKELLNSKVKHREKFRPFAPVLCEDDALKYFDCDKPIPEPTGFMLMIYPIKEEWHNKIPSVTHIDGSGRLQTIRKKQNSLYYDLIKEFGKLSGIPILINTSFNIRGEPIVCTPFDAYKCMMGTGIDYLIIDKFLIKRGENQKDMWNSEKYAKD